MGYTRAPPGKEADFRLVRPRRRFYPNNNIFSHVPDSDAVLIVMACVGLSVPKGAMLAKEQGKPVLAVDTSRPDEARKLPLAERPAPAFWPRHEVGVAARARARRRGSTQTRAG
jgi:hypothetical protein